MGFAMFSAQSSPIAIEFGSSSVKMLQVDAGEQPTLVGAVGLRIPDELRDEKEVRMGFLEGQMLRMLRKGKFRGKRVICSVPSTETFVQHMQVPHMPGSDARERDDLVKSQLQAQLGWPPYGMVIRTYEVANIHREGEQLLEVICAAMNRETVMRYVGMLRACKMEVVGVHSEIIALLHAFDSFADEGQGSTAMYVDIGWSTTKVAIGHEGKLAFARVIQVGGRHIDEKMAKRLGCDAASARAQRVSEQVLATATPQVAAVGAGGGGSTGGTGGAGTPPEVITVAESLEEELSMCVRYHQSIFRDRKIDRVVFTGGEARDIGLCQHIARTLRLPAQLGDPLTRLEYKKSLRTPGLALGQPQPGWAVACGLSTAPTDL